MTAATDTKTERASSRLAPTLSPSSPPRGFWLWRFNGAQHSLLLDRRAIAVNSILAILLAFSAIASLASGSLSISVPDILLTLQGNGSTIHSFVIQELRLPRFAAGALSGAALALAGCLMQTLARNRLATPGIIGIDNAATAFAVASIVSTTISLAPSAMALAGAATATAVAFGLAGATGTRGYRFIIAGLAIGAVSGAVTQVMLSGVALDDANAAYPWTVGSLNARNPTSVIVLTVGLGIGYLLSLAVRRGLSTLQLPESVAVSLGTRPGRVRFAALALSVLMTGFAVSVAGPVGLIALLGPELARTVSRPGRIPLTASALAGALLMTLSDLAGRTLLEPLEIPVGIVTALAGSPYLLWILLRKSPDISR
ncbi:FecCD family ABC transporter permease [Marinobacter salinexigens]|uniref:FecCD family ABC transporter permease n=1 Tax=Marinobacter salinexigens TaxID=2919747 RepID=UPI001FEC34DE|nr:iron ABC transporter permease [Marinobacter salinexigens]